MGYGYSLQPTAFEALERQLWYYIYHADATVALPKAITGAISISDPGFLAATVPILAASMTYQCPELGASTKV